jgi:small multidrug resistance pump
MRYFLLALAIVFEVSGTTALKASEGFTRLAPSVLVAVSYATSFVFLGLAAKRFDIGVLYAIWSGLGVVLICLVGAVLFREPFPAAKVVCLGLIVAGVVGLHLVDAA